LNAAKILAIASLVVSFSESGNRRSQNEPWYTSSLWTETLKISWASSLTEIRELDFHLIAPEGAALSDTIGFS